MGKIGEKSLHEWGIWESFMEQVHKESLTNQGTLEQLQASRGMEMRGEEIL